MAPKITNYIVPLRREGIEGPYIYNIKNGPKLPYVLLSTVNLFLFTFWRRHYFFILAHPV
jgi:hypothetical protein